MLCKFSTVRTGLEVTRKPSYCLLQHAGVDFHTAEASNEVQLLWGESCDADSIQACCLVAAIDATLPGVPSTGQVGKKGEGKRGKTCNRKQRLSPRFPADILSHLTGSSYLTQPPLAARESGK